MRIELLKNPARTETRSRDWTLVLFLLFAFGAPPINAEQNGLLNNWHQIGSGTLRYLGFSLYTASYYERPLSESDTHRALRIRYHRKITDDQLVSATEQIWEKMGQLSAPQRAEYSERLRIIWPTVDKQDELIFTIDTKGIGIFYFNGDSIGEVRDPALSDAFFGIWLSPNTPNQKLRKQLLGLTNS
jgi:Chalcone isomerase-like